MTLFAPILVAVLAAAQAQAPAPAVRTISGEVVDGRGKTVENAHLVLYAPPAHDSGTTETVEVNATSNAQGKFEITIPQLGAGRDFRNWANVLAYRPRSAIGAVRVSGPPPFRLVLQDPDPRTVRIERPGSEPVAGVRVALRRLYVFSGTYAEISDSLADSLAVVTGPDGTATIGYVAARDQLVAVRISSGAVAPHDFLLVEQPGRSSQPALITIRLKATGGLVGRVISHDGRAIINQPVELWSQGQGELLPYLARFKGDPPRTDKDGSFQTQDSLMVGSMYRVAVREPGKPPIVSDWITLHSKQQTLPPLVLGALREIRGRVVDRQGNPISNAEVFQTANGPEPTTTSTDTDGQFALGGFKQGPAFLFVRRDRFRFHGQLVEQAGGDVTIELTRTGDQPLREMRMLADPIDEFRALARRLVEPCWNVVAEEGEDGPARIATAPSDRLLAMAEIADRWVDLGETVCVKSLFSEGLKNAGQMLDKTDSSRSRFTARLARVDLPAALAIASDFAGQRRESSVLGNIAFRVAAENPAEAERIRSMTRRMSRHPTLDPALAWKLGTIDPASVQRALEGMPWINQRPELFLYLALGAKAHDESASRRAIEIGLQGIDRIVQKGPDRARFLLVAGSLLPLVERIDPTLVPEILWRAVAARTPVVDPGTPPGSIPGRLIAQLAWFDHDVAAALFETTRMRMVETTDLDPASSRFDFLTWSLFDPRAAVARLEQITIRPNPTELARNARLLVAASLGRKHADRWAEIFPEATIIQSGIQRDF
jgi:Carboxypeptidase regulatory-like domain